MAVPDPAAECVGTDEKAHALRRLHAAGAARGVAAERTLLERLDGGCQLPFGVNVQPAGGGWKLEAFLAAHAEDTGGVRFTLEGDDPAALGEEAWRRLRPHREAARR